MSAQANANRRDVSATRVVFLAGTGRSGSTLLGRALGTLPGYVHVGEISHLWERGLRDNQLCGCGAPFGECPFWVAVLTDMFGSLREAHEQVDRLITVRLGADRGSGVFWGSLHGHRWGAGASYAESLSQLVASIRRVSGADVVVDSSKRPSHGIWLARAPGVELYCLHLTRDSRAYIYSTQRRQRRPEIRSATVYMDIGIPWRSTLRWDLYHSLVPLVARLSSGCARVRYEDFVAQPSATVVGFLAELGLDPEVVAASSLGAGYGSNGEVVLSLPSEHTVSGNPMRFETGEVMVDEDDEWLREMALRDRRLVTVLSLPLLTRFGYVGRSRAGNRS